MDVEETPVPLPSAPAVQISPNATLQPPLTRRGKGPGLVIFVPKELPLVEDSLVLDPPPLQKWAEEGYTVLEFKIDPNDTSLLSTSDSLLDDKYFQPALTALYELPELVGKDFGCIVYSNTRHSIIGKIAKSIHAVAIVSYDPSLKLLEEKPELVHFGGKEPPLTKNGQDGYVSYHYPETKSGNFIIPKHQDFLSSSAAVAHTRTLAFLKKHMGGPTFDLEAIWEEHTNFEFGNRSVANTMGTMVQEPYVNHIPTMTGGVGRKELSNFYRYHFIWSNPEGTNLELVSRTIGIDRVIDEFIFTFTHNKTVDWLIPGIPPTGRDLRIPMTSVVNVRGDRLYHEHIAWDQATVLVQLGLMPKYLPFPYEINGKKPCRGKRFEYRVPAAGVETAQKLVDESAVKSNEMFDYNIREVDDV